MAEIKIKFEVTLNDGEGIYEKMWENLDRDSVIHLSEIIKDIPFGLRSISKSREPIYGINSTPIAYLEMSYECDLVQIPLEEPKTKFKVDGKDVFPNDISFIDIPS